MRKLCFNFSSILLSLSKDSLMIAVSLDYFALSGDVMQSSALKLGVI
jgi:hypothetical protein